MAAYKTTFHRDMRVSVNGVHVGTWSRPDPSGWAHVRAALYTFHAIDGSAENHKSRDFLQHAAQTAFRRLTA